MKQSNPSKRDIVMIAEQNAQKHIENVMKEKDDIMKKARNDALKEIKIYEEDIKVRTQGRITELNLKNSDFSELEKEVQKDVLRVEELYKKNKANVIDFLVEHVKFVHITVPEVVKGNFDIKLGK